MNDPAAQNAGAAYLSAINAAADALRHKRTPEAENILAGLLAIVPSDADALRLLGLAQQQRGDYVAAIASLRKALAARPDDGPILIDLGSALRGGGDLDGAIATFRFATETSPTSSVAWYSLAKALKAHAYPEQARTAFERTLELDPEFTEARGTLGDVLNSLGDIPGAVACYRACLQVRAHAPRAWFHLTNLKTVRMSTDDVVELRRWAADPSLGDKDRIFIGYALSKALDDQREHAAAFVALTLASRLKRQQVAWDAATFSNWISAIDTAFALPPAIASDTDFGHEVIFVVSLPRAGSTLTEQILSAHPQVEGANELVDLKAVIDQESARRGNVFPQWVADATPADWRRLGEAYLERTARWRLTRPRFTDKGLDNWPLIGAAAAMLPGARFINCRRDALETCLSCYRQLFAFGNNFTYDIAELAAQWHDYDRLSRAWRARYPGRFFEEVYEDLLADPEAQVRKLLQFLDLPFDPACLDSHRSTRAVGTFSAGQVRQPLRRDTARADLYGAALDPLRAALAGKHESRR